MSATVTRRLSAAIATVAVGGVVAFAPGAVQAHPAHDHGHGQHHGHDRPGHGGPKETTVETAHVVTGQYQTAYSKRNDLLWVTGAVGRPPVVESSLTALDPDTLEPKLSITPPVTDEETGALEAVYGIDVDDRRNTVWVTTTRDDGVAVYDQRTGEHLASIDDVAHSREVAVDERRNIAWVTAVNGEAVVGFDTRTFEEKARVSVEDSQPAGIALDERTGTVYATDLGSNRIIVVPRGTGEPEFVPTTDAPISIDLSRNGKVAYTASQDAGLGVVDLRRGELKETVETGEGALAVRVDPRSKNPVVVNRGAATTTVVDRRSAKVKETIETEENPNFLEFAKGRLFVVDKSKSGPEGEDTIYRIALGR